MATQVETQQSEHTIQDQAALDAGFASVFGESPAPQAADTDPVEVDEPVQAAGEEGDPVDDPEAEDELSEDEKDRLHLKDLLDSLPQLNEKTELATSQIRHLQGKLGEVNRLLLEIKSREAKSGQQEPIKLSKDTFKKLSAEYPELAEMLASDLSGLQLPAGNQPLPDLAPLIEEQVSARLTAALEERDKATEVRLLTREHKNWRDVVVTDGFKGWLSTRPEDAQKFYQVWDADYLGDVISEYKEFVKSQAKTSQKTDTAVSERNERLARAIPPRTTKTVKPVGLLTVEDGFNAVFKDT